MTELVRLLKQFASEQLTIEEFKKKANEAGCRSVILPGQITTADCRPDGSRCFPTIVEGIVTDVKIG